MNALRGKEQVKGRQGWRLFFASILCGPLAGMGVIILIGIATLLMNAGSGFGSFLPVSVVFSGAVFGAVVGWPAMLLFGLPAHAVLYRRRSHKIGGYLLAGVFAGFVGTIVIIGLQMLGGAGFLDSQVVMAGGLVALIMVLASVAAASLFWWIRRPDRDVVSVENLAATFE